MSDMTALLSLANGSASPPLLTVSGLEASFGPVRALSGVDLAVQPGELIALAGENGAGKTTLVRCIAGDISPASGEIHLAGRKVAANPVARAVKRVWNRSPWLRRLFGRKINHRGTETQSGQEDSS